MGGGHGIKTFQSLCDLGKVYILSSFSGFWKCFSFSTKERKGQSGYGDKGFCGSEGKGEKPGNQDYDLESCSAIFL